MKRRGEVDLSIVNAKRLVCGVVRQREAIAT